MSFPALSRRTLFGGLLAGAVGFFTRAKVRSRTASAGCRAGTRKARSPRLWHHAVHAFYFRPRADFRAQYLDQRRSSRPTRINPAKLARRGHRIRVPTAESGGQARQKQRLHCRACPSRSHHGETL